MVYYFCLIVKLKIQLIVMKFNIYLGSRNEITNTILASFVLGSVILVISFVVNL